MTLKRCLQQADTEDQQVCKKIIKKRRKTISRISALWYLELLTDCDEMDVGNAIQTLDLSDGDTIGFGNVRDGLSPGYPMVDPWSIDYFSIGSPKQLFFTRGKLDTIPLRQDPDPAVQSRIPVEEFPTRNPSESEQNRNG